MKPFLCIDITENKKNDANNGEDLIIAKAHQDRIDSLNSQREAAEGVMEKSQLPLPAKIVERLSLFFMLTFGISIAFESFNAGFVQTFKTVPALFIIFFVALAVWVTMLIIAKKRHDKIIAQYSSEDVVENMKKSIEQSYEDMNVPKTAVNADVLIFRYKIKDGKIIPKAMPMMPTAFINIDFKLFLYDDSLCIADIESLYSVPLASLKAIKHISEKISVPNWNKDKSFNDETYRQFNLTSNNYGCISFDSYYILEFEHSGEPWGIYFPPYELNTFENLCKIKVGDHQGE